MDAKVLDFVEGDGLILAAPLIDDARLGEGAEGANFDTASRGRADGVDDNGEEGVFVRLMRQLRGDVNARQPAAVARMGVVPAHDGLWAMNGVAQELIFDHELIALFKSGHSSLRPLHWQRISVRDNKSVLLNTTLKHSHDFMRNRRTSMHGHFQKSHGGDVDTLEVARTET
jgi:hypothetical protein